MRVLLVGAGGREHALTWCLRKSPLLSALFMAPGNPGMAELGTCINIDVTDIAALVDFAKAEKIDLVVPGPEAPLVAGLTDACDAADIACAGPTQAAAALEGSKAFTKEIADAAGIPTARWERFDTAEAAHAFIQRRGAPIVVKADGLAAGKGVIVAQTVEEAQKAVDTMLTHGGFGSAGSSIVVEECLFGAEVSLFAFCDGTEAVLIGAARDHKRVGENDTGPNTGGMGAVSPPPDFDVAAQEAALDLTVRPMLAEMQRRGTPFKGVIFAGLMLTDAGPKLIEYNVRFGDPEAEALLLRLESDLLPILSGLAKGAIGDLPIRFSDKIAISIVIAAQGYPATPKKGGAIKGIEAANALEGVKVFHAGTSMKDGHLVADGGRVLAVAALGDNINAALTRGYEAVSAIKWDDGFYRRDIGR
ncbi:MAG: phosphoribosylamine--glycine ligase [Acetobacteraceae bacterium]